MPPFYKQIMECFLELKCIYDLNEYQEFILFNNKDILIGGKPVFYQDWFEKGVYSICDIIDFNGKYLSFESFRLKFPVKSNFLVYFQILSAIPKRLLEKAKTYPNTKQIFTQGVTTFQLSSSLSIDLSKLKCKDYYWLFLNKNEPSAAGPRKWERDLPQYLLMERYFQAGYFDLQAK
ncbi:hypothetical protein OS493_004344 [Desmophyllum pertusum]|uniref:Uncharacterized protein n=1 Tax=Desmophyllum pertusum TaxID=174260 RepID=A0A9W9ZUL8_9CNID|nr:hypothetical protein OS493_004344 [Desmophyllum pertusum]